MLVLCTHFCLGRWLMTVCRLGEVLISFLVYKYSLLLQSLSGYACFITNFHAHITSQLHKLGSRSRASSTLGPL